MKQKSVILSLLVILFGAVSLRPANAEDAAITLQGLDTKLSAKLASIEQKQNDILSQLAAIKEELYIVKIRASLKA